jgi:hypothetical protein
MAAIQWRRVQDGWAFPRESRAPGPVVHRARRSQRRGQDEGGWRSSSRRRFAPVISATLCAALVSHRFLVFVAQCCHRDHRERERGALAHLQVATAGRMRAEAIRPTRSAHRARAPCRDQARHPGAGAARRRGWSGGRPARHLDVRVQSRERNGHVGRMRRDAVRRGAEDRPVAMLAVARRAAGPGARLLQGLLTSWK